MKNLLRTLLFIIISTSALHAQDITGDWYGILSVQGTQLRIVFHIEESENGYSATFDSPDQGAADLPFTDVTFEAPLLSLSSSAVRATYEGELKSDSLIGSWKQGAYAFPLNMSRDKAEKKAYNRPQEPEKPYPYRAEEITFENEEDSVTLAGTLTLPDGKEPFPAVILISGSGPQNRNEEVFGHKPFLVLADHLTRNGIAVLRYDDRGTAGSTGNFASATSMDFARDVMSAIGFLKMRDEINPNQIGLIGHSEGGLIAPIAANNSEEIAFMVLLAGTGVPGKEISLMQAQTLTTMEVENKEAYRQFFEKAIDIASSEKELSIIKGELTAHYKSADSVIAKMLPEGTNVDNFIRQQVEASLRPWARFFYSHDPAAELRSITIPVLSLIGSNDVQVPADMNHPPIREALKAAGNQHFVIKELEGLNHMFQESNTGSMNEYAEIEQTFSPIALEEISGWIKNTVETD